MARYDNILETIGDTPLVKLGKLAPPGVNVYVKVESRNPMGSVKDRMARAIIERAEATGALKPGCRDSSPSHSKTCIPHGRACHCRSGRWSCGEGRSCCLPFPSPVRRRSNNSLYPSLAGAGADHEDGDPVAFGVHDDLGFGAHAAPPSKALRSASSLTLSRSSIIAR